MLCKFIFYPYIHANFEHHILFTLTYFPKINILDEKHIQKYVNVKVIPYLQPWIHGKNTYTRARYVLGANMFKRADGITLKEDHGVQAR
jgi:hypothetical protein